MGLGGGEAAQEDLKTAFTPLATLGYAGHLIVPVPSLVPTNRLWAAMEAKRPNDVEPMYAWPELWQPGRYTGGLTQAELDQAPEQPQARLVLLNAQETGVDPMLHFLDQPYDDIAREKYGQPTDITQKESIKLAKTDLEAKHKQDGLNLQQLTHRDFALLSLIARIRGKKQPNLDPTSENYPLNRGSMRVGNRHDLSGGRSAVLVVRSDEGQAYFLRAEGGANPDVGVGLSAGQEA